ncbi:solute carrier family 15 member 5-like protein [Willisornis vidua]|uniref:Solute carrier family 15 member 5-like protein n=1 Tax=Willisornis vidua TaxID=1566151 RepID=A0ABQ9DTR2_9PASS|nr:solute carrier family 15 member 5-like protein [Willisornis vidua]
MPHADRRDVQEKGFLNHMADKEQRPLPGRRNHDGKLSQPEKKLQEAICVLLVELCERFTFFGIVCNMILFCTVKLGYRNYQAAIVNMSFVGTSMLTPVLVGWLAECLVGRIKLVCICMFLHFLGQGYGLVIFLQQEKYVLSMGAENDSKEYNLDSGFYWLVNLNSAVVFVSISYIQQSVARNLGFLIPFVSGLMAMITIHMVRGEMIYKPKTDSSLLTTFGVITSALKTCCVRYRYFSGGVTNWLDHAKENHGGQYSEIQVESTKSLARLFPLFTFQILYRTCIMQIPSGYYLQTMNSNLHFSGFVLPVAAMNVISIVPLLILVPILECINSSCLFSSKDTGYSPTVYIGNWFPHLLHEGKLERFFFFLASLMMVNTLGFWTIAHRYNNLHQDYTSEFRGSLPGEKLLKHEKTIKHYDTVLESSPILSIIEKT